MPLFRKRPVVIEAVQLTNAAFDAPHPNPEHLPGVVYDPKQRCALIDTGLHLLHNYDECNKPDSFLHVLIPRSKDDLSNEQCSMFVRAPSMGLDFGSDH